MKVRREYTEDLEGYLEYQDGKLKVSSLEKYTPIIASLERKRNGMRWKKMSDDVIEFEFLAGMAQDYRDRYGKDPAPNTVRGWH